MVGFLDDIFGVSDARDDLRSGSARSGAELAAARARARGEIEGGRSAALDLLAPDIEGGDLAREELLTALGLRGTGPQAEFFGSFENDPGFQAELEAGTRAIEGGAANRGGLLSGRTLAGVQEFGQRMQRGAFQDRLNRLRDLSRTGSSARGSSADVEFQTGGRLGDLEFVGGQLEANRLTDLANAMASTRGAGINNLISAGINVGRAFS